MGEIAHLTDEKLNRNHKSSVFSSYFSENNARMVELYNAIENKNYPLDTPVIENTLEDALYKDRLNDLSFVLDDKILVLIEHQSTINRNMALRLLMYAGRLYEKIVNTNEDLQNALYNEEQLQMPTPKFVVLYNGKENIPEHSVEKLSDIFMLEQENPALELKVDVYNINYGKSEELMKRSSSIYEYACFVHCIEENRKAGLDNKTAVKQAIRECISTDIMAEYLLKNGSEVENMLYHEWDREKEIKYAEKRAIEQGKSEERKDLIRKFSRKLSPEEIADTLQVSKEYVIDVLQGEMCVGERTAVYEVSKQK